MAVTFDAVGAGNGGSGTSFSENHTIAADATAIIAFVNLQNPSGLTRPSLTVTVGGQAMTELGTISYYDIGGASHHIAAFGKLNPLTGVRAVAVTLGSACYTAINSVSYKGVTGFGSAVTNLAANGSATLTVPSAVNQMVAQAFSAYTTDFTAYNKTSRWNRGLNTLGAGNMPIVIGDSAGAAPNVTFTATTGTAWGGVGVPLLFAGSSGFFAMF